ncbi:restriction endonuclease subunit S [Psychrobacter sp. VH5]|uniref:restriction endonuclease subunit S n=1 Tax=Psychrobacter sp. VH5 TaxID=3423439 RepID=UPI003D65560E
MATPKLRFKEFDGYLEKNNLINLTLWASGGTPSKKNKDYWMGDIPLISGASMHTRKICESEFNITDLGLKKGSKLAPKNSILILVRGSMLFKKIPMGMALKDVAFNQDVKSIITKEDLNEYYFFQWLLSQENIIQNKVTSTGIGAGKLDTSELQNLEIYYPAKEEQTKIATFLSAVDTKIDELTQKHELLTEYKKGMMQQLFSQKLRFQADDGSDFEDWEYMSLHEVLDYEQPTRYIVKTTDYDDSFKTAVLTAGKSFILGYTNEDNDIFEADNKNVIIFDDFTTAYKFVDFPFKVKSSAMKILQTKSKNYDIFYIYSVFSTINIQKGDEHKRRWISEYSQIEVPIPSLPEQTKIANFLTAIDQKIDNVAEQIDHAKTWKKGLLQQMFV